MLILADHQLTGEILGKPFYGKTRPPAEGGAPPAGLFQLYLPDKDPVFGAFVMALRPGPGSAAGIVIKASGQAMGAFKGSAAADIFEKRTVGADRPATKPVGGARMVEWKMPAGLGDASAHFGDQVKPGGAEGIKIQPPGNAESIKIQPPGSGAGIKIQPPGGAAQFPKMQPPGAGWKDPKMQPSGAGWKDPKMQPPGAGWKDPKMQPPGDAAQFPKMQPPGDAAQFPKMQSPGGTAQFPKWQPPGDAAQFPKVQPDRQRAATRPAAQHVDGAPSAIVLSQRAIPGRYCLVVVSGFADLLSALHAAGGAQLLIR